MATLNETPSANRLHIGIYGKTNSGKSSLINCLQENVNMETGSISRKIERGKHTTRHSELIPIDEDSYRSCIQTDGDSSARSLRAD